MKSPLQRVLVYDLETGGLNFNYNPITEMAGVVVDLETLDIIEEFSVMFLPRLDLGVMEEEPIKEAKVVFNNLAQKDAETNIKTLYYKGNNVTLKSLDILIEDIRLWKLHLEKRKNGHIITYDEYLEYQEEGEFRDISKVYFDNCYNPEALEVTHMSIELLLEEGITYEEGFKKINDLIIKHTVGNSKPILAGHNIKGFDNPFMEKFFQGNKSDFLKAVNKFMIDTLEWARVRWFELPSFSLGVCANTLGLTLKEAHRALPDTIANAKFLILLIKSMRGEGSQESTYERRKLKMNF